MAGMELGMEREYLKWVAMENSLLLDYSHERAIRLKYIEFSKTLTGILIVDCVIKRMAVNSGNISLSYPAQLWSQCLIVGLYVGLKLYSLPLLF
jgi:hypothetical protein